MRKIFPKIFVFFAVALLAAGCGDNKTKNKIMGTTVITSENANTTANAVSAAKVSAKQAMDVAAFSDNASPLAVAKKISGKVSTMDISMLPDADGWYSFTEEGQTVKYRFLDAQDNVIKDMISIINFTSIAKINFKIDSAEVSGEFTFGFLGATLGEMYSARLTFTDSAGIEYEITMSDVEFEGISITGEMMYMPIKGTITITCAANNITGTFNYVKSGAEYRFDGVMDIDGQTVNVFMVFDDTLNDYTGYYVIDGVEYEI
ncbi:MAG: hypothetical protein ABH857_04095 [Elusimicrobiota bacterium]